MNLEQLAKQFIRSNICPKCLERMLKSNPKMIGCIFQHNDDEHLCQSMTPEQAIDFAIYLIRNIPKDNPHEIYMEGGIIDYLEKLKNN